MTKQLPIALAALLCLAVVACSKDDATKSNNQPAANRATKDRQHAPADGAPGSHEDWCQEHAVPESQCARCNPALIPAFKATGDWCEEHGLPESQCVQCNPDLTIVRPPPGGSTETEE